MALVPPVGLGVDERTLDYKLLLWLRTLVRLVTFFMAL